MKNMTEFSARSEHKICSVTSVFLWRNSDSYLFGLVICSRALLGSITCVIHHCILDIQQIILLSFISINLLEQSNCDLISLFDLFVTKASIVGPNQRNLFNVGGLNGLMKSYFNYQL